jgi:hypothetical protein
MSNVKEYKMALFSESELNDFSAIATKRQSQLLELAIPTVLSFIRERIHKDDVANALKTICAEHTTSKDLKVKLCEFPWDEICRRYSDDNVTYTRTIVNLPLFRSRLANLLGLGHFVVHPVSRSSENAILFASFFIKPMIPSATECIIDHTQFRKSRHIIIDGLCICCGSYNSYFPSIPKVQQPDPLNMSFSPISHENEECPGCGEEIIVGANGYCAGCWQERFGCSDEDDEETYVLDQEDEA